MTQASEEQGFSPELNGVDAPSSATREAGRERPILFSAPMVRALLDGRKTQTRRAVTPDNIRLFMGDHLGSKRPSAELLAAALEWAQDFRRFDGVQIWRAKALQHQAPAILTQWQAHSTFGVPGDVLLVRETFRLPAEYDDVKPSLVRSSAPVWYEAAGRADEGWGKTRVSIHMPRWACRLRLRITDVRVERLNDISEADAEAEGTQHPSLVPILGAFWSSRDGYARLWDHINGPGAWAANPFVWAVSFEVIGNTAPRDGAERVQLGNSGMNPK
jgi:hypothetical protein